MIHLALSIAAFLFLAYIAYLAVIVVATVALWVMGVVIQCVVWPIDTVLTFIRNLGNR